MPATGLVARMAASYKERALPAINRLPHGGFMPHLPPINIDLNAPIY